MKIAVLGSGGWGTALAMLLEENGHQVTLWSYLEQESKQLQATGENPLLPGVQCRRACPTPGTWTAWWAATWW